MTCINVCLNVLYVLKNEKTVNSISCFGLRWLPLNEVTKCHTYMFKNMYENMNNREYD